MTKEPLLAFINNTQVVGATVTPHKLQVAEVDRAARITYPRSQLTAEAPTVVLIIVDALRPDHMGIYNYERATTPFLSKLAGAGKIETVDLAVSTCSNSYCGILSILASKPFRDITQPNFKVYDLLYDQGYNVYFIVSGTHNNWYNLRAAYGESIDLFFDGSQSTWGSNDDRLLFDGLQLVPPSSGDPAFFYFHLMSVHLGGVLQPEYERFGSSQIKLTSSFLQQNEEILVNRYDSAIVQADAYIEQIFHVLDSKGYLENSFIVITSDHGENLDTTKSIGHSWNLDQSQIRIPLVVYDSTGRKLNDSATGTHIDIAPTIVDRIGLPIPQVWQGQSLFHEAKERFTFHETQKAPAERAVIYWQQDHVYKMVLQSDKRLETAKVFDIAVDPEAKTDLATTIDRILLEKLKQAYRHHWVSAKE